MGVTLRRLLLAAALLAVPAQAEGLDDECDSVLRVAEARGRLAAVAVPERPLDEGRLPPEAVSFLAELKTAFRRFVQLELARPGDAGESAAAVQARLLAALARGDVRLDGPPGGVEPGYDLTGVAVERPAGRSDVLVVLATYQVPCADDHALYLFLRRARAWELVLALESGGWAEANGAFGSLRYGISPPASRAGLYVAAANVQPWCVSNWLGIAYRALRPGDSPDRPEVLVEGEHSAYQAFYSLDLSIDAAGFQLDFQAEQGLDTGLLVRSHVLRFRVDQDGARRVDPVALDPQGFVDEWLGAAWSDAKGWSDPAALDALGAWHCRLGRWRGLAFTELLEVEPCGAGWPGEECWRVPLDLEPRSDTFPESPPVDPSDPPFPVAFTVTRSGEAFRMVAIARHDGHSVPCE